MSISFQFILVILSLFENRRDIYNSDTTEIPAYFMLACIIWCMDESVSNAFFLPLLLISHTESLLQKRILHFGGSYYPFVNMHKNSPQKFWLWGSAPYAALASSNWKTDSRSLCHFWKNIGSNYLTRRTDIWIYVHKYLFLKW